MHRQGFSSVHTRAQALCTRRRIPSSVYTQEDSKLCVHTGGFRALCTRRRIPGSVHTRAQALCTGKGPSSVHTRAQALCTGRGSKLCVQARVQALCTKGFKLCAQARLQALCTGRGSKLCAQARVQLCAHKGSSSVHKRAQLCAQAGVQLCAQTGLKLCAHKAQSSVHTRVQALCTKGFYLQKHTAFKLSDRTSLSSTVFYNPLPRHIHGKSNSFSASLGAKSILEKGLSTYFAESPLDFSVFLDFKSAKSTSVHREHLQKRLYPVFLPEPELPHLLQQSPSDCFCTVAGYNFALKSA